MRRTDRPEEEVSFHFHEGDGLNHNRREDDQICILGRGKIYSPAEFAMQAAKCKAIKDIKRFKKMLPLLILHR